MKSIKKAWPGERIFSRQGGVGELFRNAWRPWMVMAVVAVLGGPRRMVLGGGETMTAEGSFRTFFLFFFFSPSYFILFSSHERSKVFARS